MYSMVILKKSDILDGIDKPRKIFIDALEGELWLRPLSSAEITEIVNIEAEGYGKWESTNTQKGRRMEKGENLTKGYMHLAKLNSAEANAKYECAYKSLDNPKNEEDPWELEEVKKLPHNAIKEIYEKVFQMSGANTTEADVKDFLEN